MEFFSFEKNIYKIKYFKFYYLRFSINNFIKVKILKNYLINKYI